MLAVREETIANWQEIGQNNFRAAVLLHDSGFYRNATSRFYYAAFSLLTYELARKAIRFRLGRQTPAHVELPELIVENLTQFTEPRRISLALAIQRLYRLRLDADYFEQRVDRRATDRARLDAARIFRYFGVDR